MPLALKATETLLLRVSALAIGLGVNVVISRALGPEGRGQYTLAVLAALILATLGKLGLENANLYLLGTAHVPAARLGAQNLVVSLVAGLPAILLLAVGPTLLPTIFGDMPVGLLLLAGVTIPFAIHSQLAGGLQNLTGLVTWQFRALLLGAATQLVIAGVLAGTGRLDVTSALESNIVGTFVSWLLIVYRDGWGTLRLQVDLGLLTRSLRYSLVVHLALVLLFLQQRLNVFVVKALLDTVAVGQYTLALSLGEAFLLASDSLAIAMVPQQTATTIAHAARLALRVGRMGGLVTGAAVIPGIVLGSQAISLAFGDAFRPSYAPFVVLLPGMIFLAMQRFCGPPVLRANNPMRMVRIYVVGVVANMLLNLWWIPMWGLGGAAAAATASYAITVTLFLRWTLELARE